MMSTTNNSIVTARASNPESKFKFGKCLGKGAFAAVFKAIDLATKKECAVKKILRKQAGGAPAPVAHPLLEYLIGKNLNHPAVITTIDCLQTPDAIFVQLELVNGGDLFSAISPNGPAMHQRQTRKLAFQLAAGVAYLHSKNVIHCDLKPENVLIHKGHIKICDFGLAGICGTERPGPSVGTGAYMAPELLNRRSATPLQLAEAHDTWSVGIMLYAMCFADLPWEKAKVRDADFALFAAKGGVSQQLYPFSLLASPIANVMAQTMAIRAADRPSMAAVAAALKDDSVSWYASGKRTELEFFGIRDLGNERRVAAKNTAAAAASAAAVEIKVCCPVPALDLDDSSSLTSSTSSGSGASVLDLVAPFAAFFSSKGKAMKKKAKADRKRNEKANTIVRTAQPLRTAGAAVC